VALRQSNLRTPSPGAKRTHPDPRVNLTPRQLEIALLVADGWSGSEIADRLNLSPKTVEYHRRSILPSSSSEECRAAGSISHPRRAVGAIGRGTLAMRRVLYIISLVGMWVTVATREFIQSLRRR